MFSVPEDAALPIDEFDRDGYHFRVMPPYQASTSVAALEDPTLPVSDVLHRLHEADPVVVDSSVTIDGKSTVRANALQIDVVRADFDRRHATADFPGSDDPPIDLLFDIVNSYLDRLRSIGRSYNVHRIEKARSCWRIEFLLDSGEELAPEPGKARARNGASFAMSIAALSPALWREATGLATDFEPKAWETLLMDAEAHLPAVVPAMVLCAAALETLIGASLQALAPPDRVPSELWGFINKRGDYRKEPSVAEQFDQLLHALTGHSLKETPELWEAFRNIRGARNTLMHKGVMLIGNDEITREQAFSLIGRAKEIADWVEQFLPTEARRPPVGPLMQVQVTRQLIANRPAAAP